MAISVREWIIYTLFSSEITSCNSKLRREMKLELGKWPETIKILQWKCVYFLKSGWDLMNRKVKYLGFGHCKISRLKVLWTKVFGSGQYISTLIFKLALWHHNNINFPNPPIDLSNQDFWSKNWMLLCLKNNTRNFDK